MRWVGESAFGGCEKLRFAVLNERLEELGVRENGSCGCAFPHSGLEEMVLPSTLKKMDKNTLGGCDYLRIVWTEDGKRPKALKNDSILTLRTSTMVGSASLWDLRRTRDVEIPEGVERVGEGWFASSDIWSVKIPKSVVALERMAFSDCDLLRQVEVARESRL